MHRRKLIVNRIGDFGFLIGIVLTYWVFGTVNLMELSDLASFDPVLLPPFGLGFGLWLYWQVRTVPFACLVA